MTTEEPERPIAPEAETARMPAAPTGPSRWQRVRSRSWRVAKHRVTLIVAALIVGSAIGAGTTAIVASHENHAAVPAQHAKAHNNSHHGRGDFGRRGHGRG
jgi:hypothetical protein